MSDSGATSCMANTVHALIQDGVSPCCGVLRQAMCKHLQLLNRRMDEAVESLTRSSCPLAAISPAILHMGEACS